MPITAKMFQIYKLGVILDKNYKAWLYEISDFPKMTINDIESGKEKVDVFVKSKIMIDSLKLMLKSRKQNMDEI